MTASFPGAVATEPSGVATNNPIPFSHVDSAWQEIIALEGVLRGTVTLPGTGSNLVLKSGAIGAVPLQVQGFSGQTADLIEIGSSVSASDRMILTAGGILKLIVTGTTGGISVGGAANSNIFGGGNDIAIRPSSDSTASIKFANAAATTISSFDTTNARHSIGDATAPSATLHLVAGSAPTTASFGLQFGNDATNLYRSAATTLKTDGTLSIGASLVFNDVSLSRTAADVLGFASGDGIKLTLGSLEFSGDTAAATIKVTKSATGFLTNTWYVTSLIGAETTNRFSMTAGGMLSWTEGAGSPTTLSLTAGNTGIDINKNLNMTGASTTFTAPIIKASTSFGFTAAPSLALTGSTFDLKVGGGAKTRIGLQRAGDGAFRYISIDASDQIIVETS